MTSQHTPKPWKAVEDTKGSGWDIFSIADGRLAHFHHEANAYLGAAAPELYAALRNIVAVDWVAQRDMGGLVPQARAALAKAERCATGPEHAGPESVPLHPGDES